MDTERELNREDLASIDKSDLRAYLRSKRKAVPSALRSKKSLVILDRLRSHPAYRDARYPAFTVSVGSEVETISLLQERLSQNLPVLLPRVLDNGRLAFHRVEGSLQKLQLSDRNIPEPAPDPATQVPLDQIDLWVIPGVGFDPKGHRLGQGGGFFDRLFSQITSSAPRLALAYDCQMVPLVPVEPQDEPVDEILTERTSYRFQQIEVRSEGVEETHLFAKRISAALKPPCVVRLAGVLGAGKTEWVRGFANALGWEGRVRSPSFSLENVYQVQGATLYHLDGYRLVHPNQIDREWFEEILEDPSGIVLLEWPDRFGSSVPFFSPELLIERLEGESRRMVWTAHEVRHSLIP